jgi:hypothetical protein
MEEAAGAHGRGKGPGTSWESMAEDVAIGKQGLCRSGWDPGGSDAPSQGLARRGKGVGRTRGGEGGRGRE